MPSDTPKISQSPDDHNHPAQHILLLRGLTIVALIPRLAHIGYLA
jgi:hypothetical protein